ncbi:phosphate ABC transporter substrate-binding protein, PhoT family [Ginsengibacter hankyongi]|uniref:Phosphate ABC transporter substrate-binding protein, PhoT family n=1 Tax=Ginsengibacter hankyongi TaxID=2607284 RepID=A0A5J5IGC2_9BACT|nr:substrate-binding domain-containing protein [Ginsengibacter hankyongi]KAA9039141.1 phosphate ABC transporter substrate-binding protein, PhoT family [Ginsengibacter hankyongi]
MIHKLKNKRINLALIISAFALILLPGCSGRNVRTDLDTTNSGIIHISVDESFEPVIDSQIQVFEALYPKAKIIAEYKPEADCFKDLIKDSTRMIIVTRGLTDQEEKFYKDSLTFYPAYDKLANDAVAVIVNNDDPDSLFSMDKIRGILNGSTGDKQVAVFDGLKETSTIRFAIDSILKGKPFDPKKVFAEKNSLGVINYVADHKNVLGFVGVSWIGNKEDTSQLSFLKKVRIAAIECNCPEKTYVKPYQANIERRRYPMVRGLYYILKENYNGLGGGFANFMTYEKGQLIFMRSYLWPAKMNFTIRSATLN